MAKNFKLLDDDQDQTSSQKLGKLFAGNPNLPPSLNPQELNPDQALPPDDQSQAQNQGPRLMDHGKDYANELSDKLTEEPHQSMLGKLFGHIKDAALPSQSKGGHGSMIGDILRMAIPAIYGAANGVGVFPGIMSGMTQNAELNQKQNENDLLNKRYDALDNYNSGRLKNTSDAITEKRDYGDKKLAFQGQNLAERSLYHKTMGGVAQQNANTRGAAVSQKPQTPMQTVQKYQKLFSDPTHVPTLAEQQDYKQNLAIVQKQGTIGFGGGGGK